MDLRVRAREGLQGTHDWSSVGHQRRLYCTQKVLARIGTELRLDDGSPDALHRQDQQFSKLF